MTSTDITDEMWRDVPGYEGFYRVSDHGRICSLERLIAYPKGHPRRAGGRLLKHVAQTGGYHRVTLCKDGVRKNFLVQWLVAAAFLGPRPEGHVVRHLDDDPSRNHLENLAYGTYSENQYDAVGNGRSPHNLAITCIRGHLLSGQNLYYKPEYPKRRQCRSCVRAYAWHQYRGLEKDPESMQAVSDRFYAETIEVAA